MSTQITTKLTRYSVVSYWGSVDQGRMLQITPTSPMTGEIDDEGHIRLDLAEAVEMVRVMSDWIISEAERRQGLLKKQISELEIQRRTVFNEIAEMKLERPTFPEIPFILNVCPK
jgi:hypothetical protein